MSRSTAEGSPWKSLCPTSSRRMTASTHEALRGAGTISPRLDDTSLNDMDRDIPYMLTTNKLNSFQGL